MLINRQQAAGSEKTCDPDESRHATANYPLCSFSYFGRVFSSFLLASPRRHDHYIEVASSCSSDGSRLTSNSSINSWSSTKCLSHSRHLRWSILVTSFAYFRHPSAQLSVLVESHNPTWPIPADCFGCWSSSLLATIAQFSFIHVPLSSLSNAQFGHHQPFADIVSYAIRTFISLIDDTAVCPSWSFTCLLEAIVICPNWSFKRLVDDIVSCSNWSFTRLVVDIVNYPNWSFLV